MTPRLVPEINSWWESGVVPSGLPWCDRGLFIGALDDGYDTENDDIDLSSWLRSVSFHGGVPLNCDQPIAGGFLGVVKQLVRG